jgi:hypothetical protein
LLTRSSDPIRAPALRGPIVAPRFGGYVLFLCFIL